MGSRVQFFVHAYVRLWIYIIFLAPRFNIYNTHIRIARLSIYAALNSDKTNGESYNITERKMSWNVRWPALAKVFGLIGVAPLRDTFVPVKDWIEDNKAVWDDIVIEHQLSKQSTLEGSR